MCRVSVVWGLCCGAPARPMLQAGSLLALQTCPVGNDKVPSVLWSHVSHRQLSMVAKRNSFALGNRIAHVSTVMLARQKYFSTDVIKCISMHCLGKFFNSFQSPY